MLCRAAWVDHDETLARLEPEEGSEMVFMRSEQSKKQCVTSCCGRYFSNDGKFIGKRANRSNRAILVSYVSYVFGEVKGRKISRTM